MIWYGNNTVSFVEDSPQIPITSEPKGQEGEMNYGTYKHYVVSTTLNVTPAGLDPLFLNMICQLAGITATPEEQICED